MNTPDHQELARLLPAPAERDLPDGRHHHHKELLMRAIDGERSRTRRPLVRPRIALPLAAAAVAAAVVVTVLPGTDRDGSGARVEAAAPGTARGATVLLDRIAAVALATHIGPVREDQYVYLRSKATTTAHIKPVKTGPLKEREDWLPQNTRPTGALGVYRENGEFVPVHGANLDPAGVRRPTYGWLASLPTDPDALYQRIRKETTRIKGQDFDQTVFDSFGALLGSGVMPSKTQAALYKAAARIPGVVEMPDGADAVGRHGVAIAREDRQLGQRTEWVFDKVTLSFLGQRKYLTKTSEWGEEGALVWADAILERAVVDRPRQLP